MEGGEVIKVMVDETHVPETSSRMKKNDLNFVLQEKPVRLRDKMLVCIMYAEWIIMAFLISLIFVRMVYSSDDVWVFFVMLTIVLIPLLVLLLNICSTRTHTQLTVWVSRLFLYIQRALDSPKKIVSDLPLAQKKPQESSSTSSESSSSSSESSSSSSKSSSSDEKKTNMRRKATKRPVSIKPVEPKTSTLDLICGAIKEDLKLKSPAEKTPAKSKVKRRKRTSRKAKDVEKSKATLDLISGEMITQPASDSSSSELSESKPRKKRRISRKAKVNRDSSESPERKTQRKQRTSSRIRKSAMKVEKEKEKIKEKPKKVKKAPKKVEDEPKKIKEEPKDSDTGLNLTVKVEAVENPDASQDVFDIRTQVEDDHLEVDTKIGEESMNVHTEAETGAEGAENRMNISLKTEEEDRQLKVSNTLQGEQENLEASVSEDGVTSSRRIKVEMETDSSDSDKLEGEGNIKLKYL